MRNQRLLQVPGVWNFRDLGGYETRDGRSLKWGRIFRSGHLADLGPRGMKVLAGLNLSAVIDFRSRFEVERKPDRITPGIKQIHLPVMDEDTRELSREIRQRIEKRHYQGFNPSLVMGESYRTFASVFTPAFRTFIHTVLNANGDPILWHCTSGKDRTGFASALLLRILGVDEETIFADYLLSNRFADKNRQRMVPLILMRGWRAYQMVRPLIGVQEEWLRAAFSAVDDHWGSFAGYLEQGLELTPGDIDQLRTDLLD